MLLNRTTFCLVCLLAVGLTAWPEAAGGASNPPNPAQQSLRIPDPGVLGSGIDQSTLKDALHSLEIGFGWLDSHQGEDGSWSLPQYPAITALCVVAYALDPRLGEADPLPEPARRGAEFLLRCVQPDGGIYVPNENGPSLGQYNTALSLTALSAVISRWEEPASSGPRAERIREAMNGAEQFLVKAQYLGEGVFTGGFGYEGAQDRAYADLSNTVLALEAIRAVEQVRGPMDETAWEGRQLDWDAAVRFLSRVQNLPEQNDLEWAQSPSEDDLGGFVYHPDESKAGAEHETDGSRRFHSYGSMSYAGLLSFIYADVSSDDPRVEAAVDWIRRHYTLEENPGMGSQGLYYNYHTMAKALAHWGEDPFVLMDGSQARWRKDLAAKLASLQRVDADSGLGYWVNDQGRWWENDPVLATSYALMAMDIALAPALGRD